MKSEIKRNEKRKGSLKRNEKVKDKYGFYPVLLVQ